MNGLHRPAFFHERPQPSPLANTDNLLIYCSGQRVARAKKKKVCERETRSSAAHSGGVWSELHAGNLSHPECRALCDCAVQLWCFPVPSADESASPVSRDKMPEQLCPQRWQRVLLLLSLSCALAFRAEGGTLHGALQLSRQQMNRKHSGNSEIITPYLLNGEDWVPLNGRYLKEQTNIDRRTCFII
ncbi:uncharacterized protein [Ambystoma mexicanum]|uniref:uncharacterized protein isoform X2 n=1 Tax=Ambystoma mexicanum TaxID=8296 RepID=UPI0037E891C9